MLTKLSKTIETSNERGQILSLICLTVQYDPSDGTVDRVVSVEALDNEGRHPHNITAFMLEHMEDCLNALVDSVDWREAYSDEKFYRQYRENCADDLKYIGFDGPYETYSI